MKPKQAFDRQLIKEVLEYHDWHGDKKVKLKGFVCDPVGEPMIWTQVVDENGHKISCLLEFDWDRFNNTFHVHEFNGCDRENEYGMLNQYMGGYEEDDDYAE